MQLFMQNVFISITYILILPLFKNNISSNTPACRVIPNGVLYCISNNWTKASEPRLWELPQKYGNDHNIHMYMTPLQNLTFITVRDCNSNIYKIEDLPWYLQDKTFCTKCPTKTFTEHFWYFFCYRNDGFSQNVSNNISPITVYTKTW